MESNRRPFPLLSPQETIHAWKISVARLGFQALVELGLLLSISDEEWISFSL